MIIYGALIIPALIAFILYRFFRHKTVWWEFIIPLAVSIILVVASKAIIETSQVTSKEYWGSFVQRIEYYEQWNEWITQTCSYSICDGKGNCTTYYYDCSYCRTNPPYWKIITTIDEEINITEHQYDSIKNIWGGERFIELNRNYYTDDGDEYICSWDNDSVKAVPATTLHYYENRVKAADQSIFHFEKVKDSDIKKYELKDYPDLRNTYQMDAVLGDSSPNADSANKKLQYINALLGHDKQVRVFVLVFPNKPIDAGIYQKWYWQGANMNEFVVCIGTNAGREVTWCNVISWTRAELLKTRVRSFVQAQKRLDLVALANYMQPQVKSDFVRRDFKEFDYLTVDPPMWAVILAYIITLIVNAAISFWIITNNYEDCEHGETRRNFY